MSEETAEFGVTTPRRGTRDAEPTPSTTESQATGRRFDKRLIAPVASWSIGAIVVTTFFAIGAWQRRWIADDGLIVLRTLRNLFAGNGPVFNAGERVEANTSTAWTYLLWFWSWVTGGQLEYVVLWVALVLSVTAIPIAMYGTARLYGRRISSPGLFLLLPLGAIVYISIPPARDFATSGLENGLVIFWVAVLWCLLLAWARRGPDLTSGRSRAAFLFLSFFAGLAPLIRPEITVLGGLVLLVLFCSPIGLKMRIAMVVAAAALPVGYQIFRMGYYAVLVPNPAIAKDASGAKWGQGYKYLLNLFSPYTLLLPLILALLVALLLAAQRIVAGRRERLEDASAGDRVQDDASFDDEPVSDADDDHVVPDILDAGGFDKLSRRGQLSRRKGQTSRRAQLGSRGQLSSDADDDLGWQGKLGARWAAFSGSMQRTSTVVAVVEVAGVLLFLYWMRQGGDFMHGRVLLAPLFILLLPVMVVPAVIPATARTAVGRRQLATAVLTILAAGGTIWWGVAIHDTVLPGAGMEISRDGIVDERRFYVANMGIENPVTAKDYLDYPRMRAMVESIEKHQGQGGVILPSANYDEWYFARLRKNLPESQQKQLTVYFLNLGMTSMNAPLDVRVVDQMGLAYPLAAETQRLQDGRIGHDKNLPTEWVIAESGGVSSGPGLPGYLDPQTVREAYVALTCEQTQARFASYKETWSFARFRRNLRESFSLNSYRIARQPEYELLRCGLTMPNQHPPR